jgi:hypothetical protein
MLKVPRSNFPWISFFRGWAKDSRMVTAARNGHLSIKLDQRHANRGTQGNSGGKPGRSGRKEWTPLCRMVPKGTPLRNGNSTLETPEAAWIEARATVRRMAARGIPVDIIGRFLSPPIKNEATLRKHFAQEIADGREDADLAVTLVAFAMACSGRDPAMTRWWLERRVTGFLPKRGKNGSGPIAVQMIPEGEDHCY